MREKPILSSEKVLRKDYDRKGPIAENKSLVVSLNGFGGKTY
jgi:hypothetical protein